MHRYTQIQDQDRKLDIMDHVNQDHSKELLMIAQSYGKNRTITAAMITDIYQEGILLNIESAKAEEKTLFVDFELKGDLKEQILYLAYNAFAKQKIEFSHNARQYFEVLDKQQLTKNMTRLVIKSQLPLPQNYAGYAYGFILKALEKAPKKPLNSSNKSSLVKNVFDRGFLWLMKHLSSQKRQKMLESMNKDIRLYTLRRAFHLDDQAEPEQVGLHYGFVDIFTHGGSAGSLWAEQLQIGSLISSRTETDDKHAHLHQGKTMLIADETAYPALAGILELWQNPEAPVVILLGVDQQDFDYFKDFEFPQHTQLNMVSTAVDAQAQRVIYLLQQQTQIDAVWGALENGAAKKIRHYLRNDRELQGKNNHIKGYWRL